MEIRFHVSELRNLIQALGLLPDDAVVGIAISEWWPPVPDVFPSTMLVGFGGRVVFSTPDDTAQRGKMTAEKLVEVVLNAPHTYFAVEVGALRLFWTLCQTVWVTGMKYYFFEIVKPLDAEQRRLLAAPQSFFPDEMRLAPTVDLSSTSWFLRIQLGTSSHVWQVPVELLTPS